MRLNIDIVLYYILIIVFLRPVNGTGCVSLDTYTFDKLLSKFKATLVKFDAAYPYGPMQDEYDKLCRGSRDILNLLVAEVPVKDYGEKENLELANKHGAGKNEFPVVKLFVEGKDAPIEFVYNHESEFNEVNLRLFVRKHSDVYVGLVGCLEEFDDVAEKFISYKNVDSRKRLLEKVEKLLHKVVGETKRKSAEVYVKYMKKIIEMGDGFIKYENDRIKSIIEKKISDKNKIELENKRNILRVFSVRDEF